MCWTGTEEYETERLWLDEMIERKLSPDEMIEQLERELKVAIEKNDEHTEEEYEFLTASIERIRRMTH